QKRDEVPKGTLSCPDRIMEVCYQLRHYEGSHLLPSVCGRKLIQQTLNKRTKPLPAWSFFLLQHIVNASVRLQRGMETSLVPPFTYAKQVREFPFL
ncbi:MAG: hypothetical protein MR505_08200, partial [Bacteroidales bacterium]|nr:hypothetical protein [Bacteroidales bacterium]